MQVDPIRPTLKVPGYERLKLSYDGPLSIFAFNLNLRRYTEASEYADYMAEKLIAMPAMRRNQAGRCRLTLWNPR